MPYVIALVVIVALGVGFTLLQSPSNTTDAPPTAEVVLDTTPGQDMPTTPEAEVTPAETTATPVVETASASDYVDGVHTTEVTYLTPARSEYLLDISLTLNNDIVTGASIAYSQGAEKDPNVAKFEAAYKSQVIGKDIDTLNLSRVGGASLTTAAFNEALTLIKADAQS
jgi:hypothetical protein